MTDDREMDAICQAIGSLIVWCNMIDQQMNQVVANLFVLPDAPMIEPIVAQLDIRQKLELLKARAKLLPSGNGWRVNLLKWLKNVETVNERRNLVAHHHVVIRDNKATLASSQLIKIMKALDSNMKPKPKNDLSDIESWSDHASHTMNDSLIIIENTSRFRELALQKLNN